MAVAKGLPPQNPAVRLPAPVPGARDRVGTVAQARRAGPPTTIRARPPAHRSAGSTTLTWALALLSAVVVLAIVLVSLAMGQTSATGQLVSAP